MELGKYDEDEELLPLMALSTSNVGGLAGAIAAQVRQSGAAKVGTVGPHAWCNALKAMVIAAKYMEADMAGKSLAVVPVKHEIAGEEAQKLTETVVCSCTSGHCRRFPSRLPSLRSSPLGARMSG